MMNRCTGRQIAGETTARDTGRPAAWRRWRAAAVTAVAAVAGAAVLAGCGQEIPGAVPGPAAAAAAADLAAAANAGCVQATPVVASALSVLTQLRQGAVTAAAAGGTLSTEVAGLEKLVQTTPSEVLRLALANTDDAFTAFRAVMQNPNAPAYLDTFDNLAGTLSGFHVTCSVVDPQPAAGPRGATGPGGLEAADSAVAATNDSTVLSRSATAHDATWSLQVANAGKSPAAVGFTEWPSWLSPTLKGSVQIALWARAVTGAPTITLQVRELSGSTVIGSRKVTIRLGPTFGFEYLAYQVRRPGASRLSVTISAPGVTPGGAFLVDNITIMRD
jgi:hypothetical protein